MFLVIFIIHRRKWRFAFQTLAKFIHFCRYTIGDFSPFKAHVYMFTITTTSFLFALWAFIVIFRASIPQLRRFHYGGKILTFQLCVVFLKFQSLIFGLILLPAGAIPCVPPISPNVYANSKWWRPWRTIYSVPLDKLEYVDINYLQFHWKVLINYMYEIEKKHLCFTVTSQNYQMSRNPNQTMHRVQQHYLFVSIIP